MDPITDAVTHNRSYMARHGLSHLATEPSKRLAIVTCMDSRLDLFDVLGLELGEAHIIRNAGGLATDDVVRSLVLSQRTLGTERIMLIHHTRCGMLAFTDDLLKAGLEGDPAAAKLLAQATSRDFTSCSTSAASPQAFHAFRGPIEPLDAPPSEKSMERLSWDVRRGMAAIKSHPWLPKEGPDAVTVRGFVYDVDTGKLEEVKYPGPMGSFS